MVIKVYKIDGSPPARAAMMACDLFGVPAEMVDVDVINGEHLKPEYLKINPHHSVPVLQDGDFVIHDSHAILTYLADTYGKDDKLYPKDVKQRTLVNQKLFFETAILFPRLRNVTYEALFEGEKKLTQKKKNAILQGYDYLEEFLSRTKFLALDHITIADLSAYATTSSVNFIVPIDSKKYPKLQAWLKEMDKQPFSQKYNAPGLAMFGEIVKKHVELI